MNKKLHLLLCILFGGIFVYAGAEKAKNPLTFLDDIRSFELLPDPYAALTAIYLPWLEILAGLAVITAFLRQGGLFLLNLSLMIFICAIVISWARGLDIRCGCFGSSDGATSNYLTLILRDILLLALGLFLTRPPNAFSQTTGS